VRHILASSIQLTTYGPDSDSDSSIEKTTNRGNKLKKRARYLREGQLASAYGSSYREVSWALVQERAPPTRTLTLGQDDPARRLSTRHHKSKPPSH